MVRNGIRTDLDSEHESVARTAVNLVPAAGTVGVGGGCAMLAFARRLGRRDRLEVVTTSLGVAMELVGAPGIALAVTAGSTLPGTDHLVGPDVEGTLGAFHLDLAVVQVDGVVGRELSADEPLVARTIEAMVLRAAAVVVIAEACALGRRAPAPLHLEGRSYSLVAHTSADGAILRVLSDAGIRIARAD
jgi:DeoR family transcriptional regulator, aga operon transcriptional repressor